LEIGAGDCSLSLNVATKVRKVYALEVSEEITRGVSPTSAFEVIYSDGCSIPLPDRTIEVAYSNQVMEHVHPDDAVEQLQNIYKVLTPGGVYICITPNRLAGPHDISQHFDPVATGLHLKEYTFSELSRLFKRTGFTKVDPYVGFRGRFWRAPGVAIRFFEWVFERLSHPIRRKVAKAVFVRNVLETVSVATK
jgi:SAM-dependent methyltransferase